MSTSAMATMAPEYVECLPRRNGSYALASLRHLLDDNAGKGCAYGGKAKIGLLYLQVRLVLLDGRFP